MVELHGHPIFSVEFHAHLTFVDRVGVEQSGDHEAGETGHQDRFEDQQILGQGKGQEHRRDRRAGTACNEGAHAREYIGGGHMAGEGLNAKSTG